MCLMQTVITQKCIQKFTNGKLICHSLSALQKIDKYAGALCCNTFCSVNIFRVSNIISDQQNIIQYQYILQGKEKPCRHRLSNYLTHLTIHAFKK